MSHGAQRDPVTQAELDDLLASRGSTEMVPILKHKADNGVMRELKHVALRGCDAHVRALAECAEGRLVSVVWYCRAFSKAVDKCMHEFGNDEALKDELRRRCVMRLKDTRRCVILSLSF